MIRQIVSRTALAMSLCIPLAAIAAAPVIDVFKSESCGCCAGWVEHLKANGFTTRVKNVDNPSEYRERGGIPNALGSCHTGMIKGYAIEGHVPASEIKRLLKEKPKAKGLAVPAMPLGSPGMEGPRKDPYDVLLVHTDGHTTVYKHYNGDAPAGQQAAAPALVDGEVKKIDREAGKITLRHGEIANLNMAPMTMVFRAKDAAMLDQVKVGDKVSFSADRVGGAITVVQLQKAQ